MVILSYCLSAFFLIVAASYVVGNGFEPPVLVFVLVSVVLSVDAFLLKKYKKQLAAACTALAPSHNKKVRDNNIDKSQTDVRAVVDKMSGVDFEKFCARVLEGNHYYGIELTPTSGDHGVDIIAWRVKRKFAIQCKRYNKNIGNKAVQEVFTGKKLYGAGEAAVITNSYFTEQAKTEAADLGVMLWDRKKLYEMMQNAGIKDVDFVV